MLSYVLRRLAGLIPTLLIIISVSFLILRLAPGGPFDQEQTLAPAVRANLERLYGLDQPLAVQYVRYLRALSHGDFGASLRERDFTVAELIRQGLPVSVTLGLAALLLAVLVGIPAGIAAALTQHRRTDYALSALSALGLALPSFVVGPLLALIFGAHARVAAGGRLGAREPALFSAAGRDARAARERSAAAPDARKSARGAAHRLRAQCTRARPRARRACCCAMRCHRRCCRS